MRKLIYVFSCSAIGAIMGALLGVLIWAVIAFTIWEYDLSAGLTVVRGIPVMVCGRCAMNIYII